MQHFWLCKIIVADLIGDAPVSSAARLNWPQDSDILLDAEVQ